MKPVGLYPKENYTFVDEKDLKHGRSGHHKMKASMRRLIRSMKRSFNNKFKKECEDLK
jgi:hypothetical protein